MSGTRRIFHFLTAFVGAAFQVIILGATGNPMHEAGVRRHRLQT